jgi:hypothetical protein
MQLLDNPRHLLIPHQSPAVSAPRRPQAGREPAATAEVQAALGGQVLWQC